MILNFVGEEFVRVTGGDRHRAILWTWHFVGIAVVLY